MDLSTRILGSNVTRELQAHTAAPVLQIGSDRFARGDLASVECFNFMAALNLTRVVQVLKVKNTRDLFERVSPADLVLPGIGAISLAVLGAAFEARSIGGESPLESWVKKHRETGQKRQFVTFHTMKEWERRRQSGETSNGNGHKRKAKRRRGDL